MISDATSNLIIEFLMIPEILSLICNQYTNDYISARKVIRLADPNNFDHMLDENKKNGLSKNRSVFIDPPNNSSRDGSLSRNGKQKKQNNFEQVKSPIDSKDKLSKSFSRVEPSKSKNDQGYKTNSSLTGFGPRINDHVIEYLPIALYLAHSKRYPEYLRKFTTAYS